MGDDGAPDYLAVYEIEADDVSAPLRELRRRSAAGETTRSDALQLDPPPVVGLYEELTRPRGGWHHGPDGMDAMGVAFAELWDRTIGEAEVRSCGDTAVQDTHALMATLPADGGVGGQATTTSRRTSDPHSAGAMRSAGTGRAANLGPPADVVEPVEPDLVHGVEGRVVAPGVVLDVGQATQVVRPRTGVVAQREGRARSRASPGRARSGG